MTDRLASIRTPWTDIINARQGGPLERRRCLEMLAERYYEPVRAFIRAVAHNPQPHDLDDLAQSFFGKFLEKRWLDIIDRERGSFRGFLMAAVRTFVTDQARSEESRKRTREEYKEEIRDRRPDAPGPEDAFNRAWARGLVHDAFAVYRQECLDRGKAGHYAVLERHLLDPDAHGNPSYADTALALAMTEKDVSNRLERGKRNIAKILRKLVRDGVDSDEAAEREMEELRRYFTYS